MKENRRRIVCVLLVSLAMLAQFGAAKKRQKETTPRITKKLQQRRLFSKGVSFVALGDRADDPAANGGSNNVVATNQGTNFVVLNNNGGRGSGGSQRSGYQAVNGNVVAVSGAGGSKRRSGQQFAVIDGVSYVIDGGKGGSGCGKGKGYGVIGCCGKGKGYGSVGCDLPVIEQPTPGNPVIPVATDPPTVAPVLQAETTPPSSPEPSESPSDTPSSSPSATPSSSPSSTPSTSPSTSPSSNPSESPSESPSSTPSESPSSAPSSSPSSDPSAAPSSSPSTEPSAAPSDQPSSSPSSLPSGSPSESPSESPSSDPSASPSISPSDAPSEEPSNMPAGVPSATPTCNTTIHIPPTLNAATNDPSSTPSSGPSSSPSETPSESPSSTPSDAPSSTPSTLPSTKPSENPSESPSENPSDTPSSAPSTQPSPEPQIATLPPSRNNIVADSEEPSESPSLAPSSEPSLSPSSAPSSTPSSEPSDTPSSSPSTSPSDTPSESPTEEPTTASPTCDMSSPAPTLTPTKNASTKEPTDAPSDPQIDTLPPAPGSNLAGEQSAQCYCPDSCARELVYRYTGRTCALGLDDCADVSELMDETFIVVEDSVGNTLFEGKVWVGAELTIDNGGACIPSSLIVSVISEEHLEQQHLVDVDLAQTVTVDSSCSGDVTLLDEFGALTFTGYQCANQVARNCSMGVVYNVTTTNVGNGPQEITSFNFDLNGDATVIDAGLPTLEPQSGFAVMQPKQIDLCTSAEYGASSQVEATMPGATLQCQGDAEVSFTIIAPTPLPTKRPSSSPSSAPSGSPSSTPSGAPSGEPSQTPSSSPSASPSALPSSGPSSLPSVQPSAVPSAVPSTAPSLAPSEPEIAILPPSDSNVIDTPSPTENPTSPPILNANTAKPSASPSNSPSSGPSSVPSSQPSSSPSESPSATPSSNPSGSPSALPSTQPSSSPSNVPTNVPTMAPSDPQVVTLSPMSNNIVGKPSSAPSRFTKAPTLIPTLTPTCHTENPSDSPSISPSTAPSSGPSESPSSTPSTSPSNHPSMTPSSSPSDVPSAAPTPLAPCEVSVEMDCATTDGTECTQLNGEQFVECDCPDSCARELVYRYTGATCASSLVGCTDTNPLTTEATIVIESEGTTLFDAVVRLGTDITITNGGQCIPDSLQATVSQSYGSQPSQTVIIDSTCGGDVTLLDGFGSLEFAGYTCADNDVHNCYVDAVFTVTTTNIGTVEQSLANCTFSFNGESTDYNLALPTLEPQGTFVSQKPAQIDLCTSQQHYATSFVVAMGTQSGDACAANTGVTFEINTGTPFPSPSPSSSPSAHPSNSPSTTPSSTPSATPSSSPTPKPTLVLVVQPSLNLVAEEPSASPSSDPSTSPSSIPSSTPSTTPSSIPSTSPSSIPSTTPSSTPSTTPSTRPSASPSSWPSSSPTPKPSLVLVVQPSLNLVAEEPSASPSADPSTSPSSIPSTTPSSTPSTTPSTRPSASPSSWPSPSPSASPVASTLAPVRTLTIPPTSMAACGTDTETCPDGSVVGRNIADNCEFFSCPKPQPVATLAPRATPSPVNNADFPLVSTFSGDNLFGPCQADRGGLFGWGNEDEEAILEFKYELETRPNIDVDDRLIFTLQKVMMENVLPALFPDQCKGSHGLNRDRARRLRNLIVVGVSAFPQDRIIPTRECETPLQSPNNSCVVVSGFLSIYTDNGGTRDATEDAKEVLEEAIVAGLFNYGRLGVVRVSLVDF
ncbi:receptor-like protein kinase [Seminavis robusta]|uniref:Circumsporozoite protein n=1 Tax=Seminavis robusta TaxID=568900 RepID=A0A9N8HJ80_9STRA|nr:receptor-like protein kinase [Seminavis robusta]|eukprot:Sro841_g209500.1 receptor-like protein kinase (1727) ;mRNA; f:8091-13679